MLRIETRGRARALQLLYAWESTGRPVASLVPGLARLTRPEPRVLDFAEALAVGVSRAVTDLDGLIQAAAEHWRLGRFAILDRNVLRIAVYEMTRNHIPPRIAIDEALWLARRFGNPESPRFVNGVLDRVARDLRLL